MKFILNTDYDEDEMRFITQHDCEILSEVTLKSVAFTENDTPRRMIKYCGELIAEVVDEEDGSLVWSVLRRGGRRAGAYKNKWYCGDIYEDLWSMAEGL